jgi:predicted AAA+ superfamily ATPase
MSFSKILTPRPELLKGDGIQGIIDIENLNIKKRKTLEATPEDFFSLTYPTSDIKSVLHFLDQRYNSESGTPGLFLLEGFKGSGKSHLELFVYHLFQNNDFAKDWLTSHNLECKLPNDATVIIHKFTDFPLDSIWNLIFEKVGADKFVSNTRPDLNQLREALSGKKVVLILDELELGFESIANKNTQAQNLSFLQMLSEEAQRSENSSITIFASIYNSNNEPGSTLKRVPRIDVKFSEPQDRKMVVLHRLFSNYGKHDVKQIETITKSFINQWKKNSIRIDEKYEERFNESYPFTPEVFDILLNRVLSKNIQGNRGPLALLGRLVKNSHNKLDIISASALDVKEVGIRNLITDLDRDKHTILCIN